MSTLLVDPSLSDRNTFLTVAYDNTIKLWNANTGSEKCSFPGGSWLKILNHNFLAEFFFQQ